MSRLLIAVVALVIAALAGCAQLKPIARTAADIARDLCALVAVERTGMSTQDAVRTFCATERQLQPWLDELLQAKQRAAVRAGGGAR